MTSREQLGPYRLLAELGFGGMGSVTLAKRHGPGGFQKWVALKTIHPHLAKQPRFIDLFLNEARVAASMQHPNVAQVFDLGEASGVFFLAMEYLHGEHLGAVQDCARETELPPSAVSWIVAQAAEGLHHAHEARGPDGDDLRLIHRDVSPQNIFVTYSGHIKVTDFGIARAEGRLVDATDTGRVKGKCSYMAPEQIIGTALDRRSDVFSLGVVLWELTTGQRLFRSATDAETIYKITHNEIPDPATLAENLPVGFATVVLKALAPSAEDRFVSARELALALEPYARGCSPSVLEEWMATNFSERIKQKSAWLHTDQGPLQDTGARVQPALDDGSTPQSGATSNEAQPQPVTPRRTQNLLLVAIAFLVAILAWGVWDRESVTPESGSQLEAESLSSTPPNPAPETEPATHSNPESGARVDEESTSQVETPPPTVSSIHEVRTRRQREIAAPGVLNLITVPWAEVSINGVDHGRTPLFQQTVPAGVLRISLRREGTSPATVHELNMPSGGRLDRRIVLDETN